MWFEDMTGKDARTACRVERLFEITPAEVDGANAVIGAEMRHRRRDPLVCAGGPDHLCPHTFRDLDAAARESPGGPHNQHPFARL